MTVPDAPAAAPPPPAPEPPTPRQRAPHRAVSLAVAVVVLALVALSAPLHRQVADVLLLAQPVITQHPAAGAALFVALAALAAMLMFFSSMVLVPLGVLAWGKLACFLMLWGGWFVGGALTYSIGRYLGRPVVRRLVSTKNIAQYESRIPGSGSFTTALLVQLTVPSDIAGYFFGLSAYRVRPYLAALALAELPYALGTVYLGAAFIERRYVVLIAAALIALAVVVWRWKKGRRRAA
jgi:uncharacterized membrane protein YdjX (TVP38/TMEM64 family)